MAVLSFLMKLVKLTRILIGVGHRYSMKASFFHSKFTKATWLGSMDCIRRLSDVALTSTSSTSGEIALSTFFQSFASIDAEKPFTVAV